MSSTAQSRAAVSPAEISASDDRALRCRARRRALICPGAGWALLGYPKRGAAVLLSVVACLAALIWLVLTLSPASVWAAAIATLLAVVVWTAEWLDAGWCVGRSPSNSLLVRRFALTTIVVWFAGLVIPLLIALRFGSIEIGDDRMSPTIEPGERLIYHLHVSEAGLKEGTVILYRLPPHAKGGTPGELVIARILAAEGDELTVQGGHYLVNGQVTRYRAAPAAPNVPLSVPSYPKKLTVPEVRYFVVQDSQSTGIDSRQLDYARRVDLVSTRLFHFGGPGILRPVE